MTYENFIVPNVYWEYVLGQRRVSFINDYYKRYKNYPSDEILQEVVLTDEEKEKYKRVFYAQYKATGMAPSEPNTPSVPIMPPTDGDDEQETPITPPSQDNEINNNSLICIYNINTTGYADLYRIRPNYESYIEKIIYNGEEITPLLSGSTVKYDFQKMGDIKVEYVLKDNTTSMHNVIFSGTRLKEIVIPSCISTLHKANLYDNGIFAFSDQNNAVFNKITSLNKTAPLLEGSLKQVVSVTNINNGYHSKGTLYVPKDCSMNYASWMGDGKTDNLLAKYDWEIKELD